MSKEENSNIIFTGSSGTIVKSIIHDFANLEKLKKFKILCLSSSENDMNTISTINNFNYFQSQNLDKILNKNSILIHFAAVTRSDKDQSKYKINEKITSSLVSSSSKNKIKKFIYISSDLAGLSKGPYGLSKEKCEKLIKNSNINYTILRLSPFIAKEEFCNNSSILKLLKKANKNMFLILPSGGNINIKFIFWKDLINALRDCIIDNNTSNNTFYAYSHEVKLKSFINNIISRKVVILNIPFNIVSNLVKVLILFRFKFLLSFESILSLEKSFHNNENIFKKITSKKTDSNSIIKYIRETL